jgi:hypothetical protein
VSSLHDRILVLRFPESTTFSIDFESSIESVTGIQNAFSKLCPSLVLVVSIGTDFHWKTAVSRFPHVVTVILPYSIEIWNVSYSDRSGISVSPKKNLGYSYGATIYTLHAYVNPIFFGILKIRLRDLPLKDVRVAWSGNRGWGSRQDASVRDKAIT